MTFGLANSKDVGLVVRAISFQDFQPMWSRSTNVTDRQTDKQTTCDRKTALFTIVHCAVKTCDNFGLVIPEFKRLKGVNLLVDQQFSYVRLAAPLLDTAA